MIFAAAYYAVCLTAIVIGVVVMNDKMFGDCK